MLQLLSVRFELYAQVCQIKNIHTYVYADDRYIKKICLIIQSFVLSKV